MGSEYSDCIASEQYGLERLDHCLSFWKPHDCAVCLTRHTMFHTKLELALLQPPYSVGSLDLRPHCMQHKLEPHHVVSLITSSTPLFDPFRAQEEYVYNWISGQAVRGHDRWRALGCPVHTASLSSARGPGPGPGHDQ